MHEFLRPIWCEGGGYYIIIGQLRVLRPSIGGKAARNVVSNKACVRA